MEWDRSHKWHVQIVHYSHARVFLRFDARPSKAEMLATRQLFPELAALPMREFLQQITASPAIDMGIRPGIEVWALRRRASKFGLTLQIIDTSHTYYVPYDETLQQGWWISDPAEAERIAKEMMAAGIPVYPIESD